MKICILLTCFLLCINSFAQKAKDKENYDSLVYVSARANGDYFTAINALYYMMAKNPSKTIAYQDSLTTLYYITKAYQKCIISGSRVLAVQPNNLPVLELVAISKRITGDIKTSLDMYEKLHSKTGSLQHAYYIAEMQFNLQRYGECTVTIEKIISSEKSEKEKIQVVGSADLSQTVMLKAAALNIKGMVLKQLGKSEDAKAAFKNALSLEKDFVLPKTNLEDIEKKTN